MTVPDVTGMRYRDAEELLRSAGIAFTAEHIAPLKTHDQGPGEDRVVRQSLSDGAVHLILCGVSTGSK